MPTYRRHNVRFGTQPPSKTSTMPAHRHRTPVESLVHEMEALARGLKEQTEANELYRAEKDAQAATQANTIALLQAQVQKQASAIDDLKKSQRTQALGSDTLLELHEQNHRKIATLRGNITNLEESFQEAQYRDDKEFNHINQDIDDINQDIEALQDTLIYEVGKKMAAHTAGIKWLVTAHDVDHGIDVNDRRSWTKIVTPHL